MTLVTRGSELYWINHAEALQRKGWTMREIAQKLNRDYETVVYHLYWLKVAR